MSHIPLGPKGSALREWLDGREFYEAMQFYRHTPPVPTEEVVLNFERVKTAIMEKVKDVYGPK